MNRRVPLACRFTRKSIPFAFVSILAFFTILELLFDLSKVDLGGSLSTTALAATPAPNPIGADINRWGEITVAQPKIWQYERVDSLLDGLLRDVQGVSLADLTSLNPNATNGAAVRFVQSMLEISAQYNQANAESNQIALQSYRASQGLANQQIQANSAYLQQLYQQRQTVTTQLLAAIQQNSDLQAQLAVTPSPSDAFTTLQNQQKAADNQVSGLQQELNTINTQIASASTAPPLTPPSLTATAAPTPPESANTFSDFLSKLPNGLQQNLINQLQSPSYPATKQLDNFVTLLYERMAREISVLQDDLVHDPENLAFLVQFDVGIYPSKHAANMEGVVEFTLDCAGCKVYSVYPGQSSYNLANYEGASKRNNLFGSLATLIGFGISTNYRRQEDTLRGDLVQSVYMSGFQEGTNSTDRLGENVNQRFGWYYGTSPFETLVTPGVRSTFAIITVPRSVVKDCRNSHSVVIPYLEKYKCGNGLMLTVDSDTTLINFNTNTGWVRRDDPSHERPYKLLPKSFAVELPGAGDVANIPNVVLAERDRLHVLGFEYNPVYSVVQNPNKTDTQALATPGTAQATATGTGSGSATVTVSGAGTATATSTGSSGTTANATATNPVSPQSNAPSSANDALTGCPNGQCAAVLLKLAESIDPNLVVTVRGQPLRRVRDWRGRGTSILPPAQSASDMQGSSVNNGSSTGTAQPPRSENTVSSSLLEADKLGPNTWMAVDSHRLLLNISKDLAGTVEFPSIQVVAPAKRALFVPIDLDTGFTEIVTNGFHLPSRGSEQLCDYLSRHLRQTSTCSVSVEALQPSGPYPFETFLPLFLPQPPDQPIDATLGETGKQILISFIEDSPSTSTTPPKKPYDWLASKTQVVIEDELLDLAWSLSCYPQSPQLVCDVPRQEIQAAYKILNNVCHDSSCPAIPDSATQFPSIASLQLWVEQYDPDGINAFRSFAPARFGSFPVQLGIGAAQSDTAADTGFQPWHFDSVDTTGGDYITAIGCHYPLLDHPDKNTSFTIQVLGTNIPAKFQNQTLPAPAAGQCPSFQIPTVALTQSEVVIEYQEKDVQGNIVKTLSPDSLPTSRFRPHFGTLLVIPKTNPNPSFDIQGWDVEIPASQVDCNDSLDPPDIIAKLHARWSINGATPVPVRALSDAMHTSCADWQQASKIEQVRLLLDVDKKQLKVLSKYKRVQVLRGTGKIAIAKLPDLWSLLLPTQLSVVPIGKMQFALQGPQAEAIDYVSVQGPGAPDELLRVAVGADSVLVTLPQPRDESNDKPAITRLSGATGKVGTVVTISGQQFGLKKGQVMLNGTQQLTVDCWSDTSIIITVPPGIMPGSGNVVVVTSSKVSTTDKNVVLPSKTGHLI